MVATLILWGYLLDRVGERIVLTLGSALTAGAAYAASNAHSMVAFASLAVRRRHGGRQLQLGRRPAGLRMVPAGATRPGDGRPADRAATRNCVGRVGHSRYSPNASRSATSGMIFPAVLCAAAAVLSVVAIKDPPRKERAEATEQELANPYRGSWVLRRIHAVSALLMVPQTLTVTFMLIWLIANYRCSIFAAGCVVTVSQVLGAVGRIIVGRWSDRVGSRLRPVRIMAVAGVLIWPGLAFADHLRLFDRRAADGRGGRRRRCSTTGLESTAITEYAGPFWSGRSLGLQNTYQRLMAAGAPPVLGELIAGRAIRLAFACVRAVPAAGGADRAGQDVAARAGD